MSDVHAQIGDLTQFQGNETAAAQLEAAKEEVSMLRCNWPSDSEQPD
jgi:hypothetical protein